MNDMSQYLV